jgi:UDP:flavonoid glycosyltransferase YjiC (YdhE family)
MADAKTAELRHVMLCTVGSSGDVHPYIGLGRLLRQRGYQVTLVTSGYFRSLAEQSGFDFVDPMPTYDFVKGVQNPDIWHPRRGLRTIVELAVKPAVEPLYHTIIEKHTPGQTIVVASTLAYGARVAQDKIGIPTVTVHLSPSIFRSNFEGPRLPGLRVHRGPAWSRRLQWYLADRLMIDPMICPWLNELRGRVGLPPVNRVYKDWWHSPHKVVAMFPEWFAAKQPDWPSQTRLTGFPLYSEEDLAEPKPEVREFVEAGSRPLIFTPGSANVFGHEFFRAAVEACQRLGRRGVLLTRFPEQLPSNLPDTVRYIDYVPFRWLLPRADLLVHHGGIGSMSQALAAGVPQVIMPMAFDQFDNIDRVERLGVGRGLTPQRFRGAALAKVMQSLLDDPAVKQRCAAIKAKFEGVDGLQATVDEIEATWKACTG